MNLPEFQTLISKIDDNLENLKDENFVQTPHDILVADCLQSLIENNCTPGSVTPFATANHLVTIIGYVENEKAKDPLIETIAPSLVIPQFK